MVEIPLVFLQEVVESLMASIMLGGTVFMFTLMCTWPDEDIRSSVKIALTAVAILQVAWWVFYSGLIVIS